MITRKTLTASTPRLVTFSFAQYTVVAFGTPEWRAKALKTRAHLVASGKLPRSSALPFPVPVGVTMVEMTDWVDEQFVRRSDYLPTFEVRELIEATTSYAHELWFDQDGHAFISFADEQDATMFRLALDGDVS